MQTRNYPRTLQDAFPNDKGEYAQSCENWHGRKFSLPAVKYDVESAGHRAVFGICLIGLAIFVLWALV